MSVSANLCSELGEEKLMFFEAVVTIFGTVHLAQYQMRISRYNSLTFDI